MIDIGEGVVDAIRIICATIIILFVAAVSLFLIKFAVFPIICK